MKTEIKEYLLKLKESFKEKENLYQVYTMKKNKIELFDSSSTQKKLSEIIKDIDVSNVDYVIKILYNVTITDYETGPLKITCIINKVENDKISKKGMLTASMVYTVKSLEKNKLMKGDYKILIKGLLNGDIESGYLKEFVIK